MRRMETLMFGGLFGKRATTKSDVILAVAAAIISVWKCADTIKEYKAEQDSENQEIAQ